jgi:hypothetical protein
MMVIVERAQGYNVCDVWVKAQLKLTNLLVKPKS